MTDEVETSDTCLDLALEGEKLCKAGKCRDGVAFFEAALQSGTDDFRTLSAIYSQLGNAYFYLGDYVRAMQYHKHDLTLARTMGDMLGEAKASGNLGNTLKVIGKFEEAVICCGRHLELCRAHKDRVGEGRALYNLGNVYHAKGKHIGRLGHQDPGDFPQEVKALFEKAVEYYEENMVLMVEIQDRAAQGRACGNLGNVHYLLGDFNRAVHYHLERLKIAREFSDRSAERRARSNLGNAHIFLGEFEQAAEHYKQTLLLAEELGDRAVEAQACYSLGNTYTLLKDYPTAVDYHLRHLKIAQELFDKVGEGRACWSLGNAHSAMGQSGEAYAYATKHLEIAKETGDRMGQATAQVNLSELAKSLGIPEGGPPPPLAQGEGLAGAAGATRRRSMENMEMIKMTPDGKTASSQGVAHRPGGNSAASHAGAAGGGGASAGAAVSGSGDDRDEAAAANKSDLLDDEEDFFDFISRFQSKRMDDQRCSLAEPLDGGVDGAPSEGCNGTGGGASEGGPAAPPSGAKQKLDLMSSAGAGSGSAPAQSGASMGSGLPPWSGLDLPGLSRRGQLSGNAALLAAGSGRTDGGAVGPGGDAAHANLLPDDNFFEQLMKTQGTRIEDQRSRLPGDDNRRAGGVPSVAPTIPDEDFFSLICRIQGGRIEDQRASLPGRRC